MKSECRYPENDEREHATFWPDRAPGEPLGTMHVSAQQVSDSDISAVWHPEDETLGVVP